jgi:ankyrin repeat protein
MWAIANGDCDFSLYLIQKLNANHFIKDKDQKNALHFVIMKSRQQNKISEYQNQLPLFYEILKHEEIKNHINDRDKNGNTSLHIAVARGDLKYIYGLINTGAALDIKNNSGQTPFDILNLSLEDRCKIVRESHETNNTCDGMYSLIDEELFIQNKDIISKKLSPDQSIKTAQNNPELKK